MKKILSLFAFVAIVFSFAACGDSGNVPEVKNFQFMIQTLSTKELIKITATDPNAYIYAYSYKYEGETVDDLLYSTKLFLGDASFEGLANFGIISKGSVELSDKNMTPGTKYVVWACRIEEDPETLKPIIGNIEYVIYETMPQYTLNGVFSVSDTKKVRFSECNYYESSEGYKSKPQWWYLEVSDDSPRDLFEWSTTQNAYFKDIDHCMLEAKEWYYLFRERPNADHLFAQATVNNNEGLIILPDNWDPDGLELTTGFDMGVLWDAEKLNYEESVHQVYFNGYERNIISETAWEAYEFAGAVFMPASKNYQGEYWSSTEDSDDNAFYLHFGKWYLHLNLSETVDPKNKSKAIRPVYVIR